jgi:hypothetical protein
MRAELKFDEAHAGTAADLGDPEHPWSTAAQEWERSLELAERFGYPVHGARAAAGNALLLERTGRVDEGCRLLESWYRRCIEGHGTPVLTGIRSELERLSTG